MKIKTLANCTPTEFVAQTVRIKKQAQEWLKLTKIMEIRGEAPKYKVLDKDASAEERAAIIRENAKMRADKAVENLSRIIDACLEEHPTETLNMLALCCFVEPEEIDSHPMSFYISAINELIRDEAVIGFFTSFSALARTDTRNA